MVNLLLSVIHATSANRIFMQPWAKGYILPMEGGWLKASREGFLLNKKRYVASLMSPQRSSLVWTGMYKTFV